MAVAANESRVEHHSRQEAGDWVLREIAGLDKVLELSSVGKSISLTDVYDKVDFDLD